MIGLSFPIRHLAGKGPCAKLPDHGGRGKRGAHCLPDTAFQHSTATARAKALAGWARKLTVRALTIYFPTLRAQLKPLLLCFEQKTKGAEGTIVIPFRTQGRLCGHLQVLNFYLEKVWLPQISEIAAPWLHDPTLRAILETGNLVGEDKQLKLALLPNHIPSLLASICEGNLQEGAEFFRGFAEAYAASARELHKARSKALGGFMFMDMAILSAAAGNFTEGTPRRKVEFYQKVAQLMEVEEPGSANPLQQKQKEDRRVQLIRRIARRCETLGFELSRDHARRKKRRRKK